MGTGDQFFGQTIRGGYTHFSVIPMLLDTLFPVFGMIVLGMVLHRRGILDAAFMRTADRLVYYIFFPAMLFWKIGGADAGTGTGIQWRLGVAALAAVCTAYVVSVLAIRLFRITSFQAGSFSQSCYRFNTYIGMAVIFNAVGESGIRHFGVLIGLVIPCINVLAVGTLIWYSGTDFNFPARLRMMLRAMVANPLILACLAGISWAATVNRFPVFIDNTLRMMTLVALPLALLSIGGSLVGQSTAGRYRLAILGAGIKLVALPFIGYGFLRAFGITGEPFRVGMIYFALPTSSAIYVLSSQLNSDTALASTAIVASTALSIVSLGTVLFCFF